MNMRQVEHSEFVTATANNAATSNILGLAINRPNMFYAPTLHKTRPKARCSKSTDDLIRGLDSAGDDDHLAWQGWRELPTGGARFHLGRPHREGDQVEEGCWCNLISLAS